MPDKRFKQDGASKTYSIQKVWDHHRQIVRLLVSSNGKYTNEEIGKMVGCSAQTVSNVRNDPMTRDILIRLHKEADDNAVDVAKEVREMFPLAATVLRNVMSLCATETDVQMADPRIIAQSTRAAVAALDHAHPKKIEGMIKHAHGHVTLGQIQEMKERVRARHTEAEVLVDE